MNTKPSQTVDHSQLSVCATVTRGRPLQSPRTGVVGGEKEVRRLCMAFDAYQTPPCAARWLIHGEVDGISDIPVRRRTVDARCLL